MYSEKLASPRTTALFVALTLIFFALAAWRGQAVRWDATAVVLAVLGALFLFYSVNYRSLEISLAPAGLTLRFGVFTWRVPWEDIAACVPDDGLTPLQRYGGAGIHFMLVQGRYRANFNFLEYPRLLVNLKRRQGPVIDLSFSTRQPDEVMRIVRQRITAA